MPPINDNVVNAITLTLPTTVSGNNTGATTESSDELSWYGANVPTIWYKWVNTTGVSQLISLSNLTSDAGFAPGGLEVDSWTFVGTPTGFLDLNTNGVFQGYTGETFSSVTSIVVPNGTSLYLAAVCYDYVSTEFGAFSFDLSITLALPPPNDSFNNAIALTVVNIPTVVNGTTVLATDEAPFFDGMKSVWYKLVPPTNTNGGELTINFSGSPVPNFKVYNGFDVNNLTEDTDPYFLAGPSVYIRVYSAVGLAFSFTYVFYVYNNPAVPSPLASPAGTEVLALSQFTHYPGHVVAIDGGSFGAGPPVVYDSSSPIPSGRYLSETQVITPGTLANLHNNSLHASQASNTIVFDQNVLGLEITMQYGVYLLIKLVGNDGGNRFKETYRTRQSVQIIFYNGFAGNSTWTAEQVWLGSYVDALPNNYDQWMYVYINHFTYHGDPTDVITLKAFTLGSPGVEIQIAQIVLMPYYAETQTSPSTPWLTDFEVMSAAFYGDPYSYSSVTESVGDTLGVYTIDDEKGAPFIGSSFPGLLKLDYQDLGDGSAEAMMIHAAGQFEQANYTTDMYFFFGATWNPARTLVDDPFDRTAVGPWIGSYYTYNPAHPSFLDFHAGNITYPTTQLSIGNSPEGYQWYTLVGNHGSEDGWGYDGHNIGGDGETAPSYWQTDGDSVIFACGGTDSDIFWMNASLGTDVTTLGMPNLTDMGDYILETSVSWTGTITVASDVAILGNSNTTGPKPYGQATFWLALILQARTDGSVTARLNMQSGYRAVGFGGSDDTFNYDITIPSVVFSSYTPGTKVRMKLRRRRYVIDAKVWLDGLTEPSTWDISGYVPGTQETGSGTGLPLPYPYTAILPGYTKVRDGWRKDIDGYPFFATNLKSWKYDSGNRRRVITTWYDFKVDYDPDGSTAKDAHFMIKSDDLAETWVPKTTIPYTRQALIYCGRRVWYDGTADRSVGTFYAWLSSGAANLAAASVGWGWWRIIRDTLTVAFTGIVSMHWKHGER